MKKKLLTIIFALFPLNLISAMPPRPGVVVDSDLSASLPLLSSPIDADGAVSRNLTEKTFPSTGTRNVLVLIVNFNDTTINAGSTPAYYDGLFTDGPSANGLSWRKYYQDMSNNNLNLEFDVYDVSSASDTHDYYGNNTAEYDDHPGQLVAEAIAAGDPTIDYSQYDNDGDGYVDAVVVIHQGQGEEATSPAGTNNIWSHRWNLFSANYNNNNGDGYDSITGVTGLDSNNDGILECDGVLLNDYTIQPEYVDIAEDSTIGVFVHEFGHILGLPDLYDTGGISDGIGNWAVMAGGAWLGPGYDGSQPAPMSAWSKAQLGWLTVDQINTATIYPLSDFFSNRFLFFVLLLIFIVLTSLIIFLPKKMRKKSGKLILIPTIITTIIFFSTCGSNNTPPTSILTHIDLADIELSHKAEKILINSNEYILSENKLKIADTWTEFLPGQGLLVYHIDNSLITSRYSSNTINDYSINGILGVRVVEADNNNLLLDGSDGDYGSATDPFYLGNVNSISNFVANSGEASSFNVSNISAIGSVISFDILHY